jgi:hypothetical protein
MSIVPQAYTRHTLGSHGPAAGTSGPGLNQPGDRARERELPTLAQKSRE